MSLAEFVHTMSALAAIALIVIGSSRLKKYLKYKLL